MKTTNGKSTLTTNDVAKLLSENGFTYEMVGNDKIEVEIDKIKFSLSCRGNDVVWALNVPFVFWVVVSLFFATIFGIITLLADGSPFIIFLGAIPTYFLYRYKPSTIKAKGKLIGFLNKNFN
jgi:hypothetical protein